MTSFRSPTGPSFLEHIPHRVRHHLAPYSYNCQSIVFGSGLESSVQPLTTCPTIRLLYLHILASHILLSYLHTNLSSVHSFTHIPSFQMKSSYDELNNSTLITKLVSSNEDSSTVENPLTSSVAAITSLKTTISNLPRVPQISRKVRACSACKKQKIRCDFDSEFGATGESAKCVRCRKMRLECVVNRSLQTILDEDVE